MPDTHHTHRQAREQLFGTLSSVTAGMLGIEGSGAHMRPMTHFVDTDQGLIWFVTSRTSSLARQIGHGGTAHHCVTDEKAGTYACLRGAIRQSENAAKLDELWSPMLAAWFKGRDDPDILLIEMTLRDAEIWTSTDSRIQFGLEIAKANLNADKTPDVGEHAAISF